MEHAYLVSKRSEQFLSHLDPLHPSSTYLKSAPKHPDLFQQPYISFPQVFYHLSWDTKNIDSFIFYR